MAFASPRWFTCLVYVSTYCVPIVTLRQNKPFRLLYLGHAQIMKGYRNLQCNRIVCNLLLPGGSCMFDACAIRLIRRKVLFSGLKSINMTPLNSDSRIKGSVFDSSKQPQRENSQIPPPHPPHFKRGGHRLSHFKNCSAGPAQVNVAFFSNVTVMLP